MAMFIQLAENDGYYSIVTAFPVREGYIKAQGKRIGSWSEITKGSKGTASPLADTLSSPFGIGAYAGGQSADNVNPKLKTVNIKDVSCITDGSASDLLVIAHEQKSLHRSWIQCIIGIVAGFVLGIIVSFIF
ncbi:MAG: hypothetical protein RRY13_08835 [Akkermansia sp.]